MKKYLPWIIVVVFAGWLAGSLRMPPDKGYALTQFGRIPVVYNGRTQPLDSLARNALLQLRGKQTANLEPWKDWDAHPEIIPATQWLLNVMTKPEVADTWPVFRIDNPDLKGLLHLPGEPDSTKQQDGKHYTWNQIQPGLENLRREAARIDSAHLESSQQTPYDRAVVHLWEVQTLYNHLKLMLGPSAKGQLTEDLVPYLAKVDQGVRADDARQEGKPFDAAALGWIYEQTETPFILPPADGPKGKWMQAYAGAAQSGNEPGAINYSLMAYSQIAAAYRADDIPAFNQAVAGYLSNLEQHGFTKELKKARGEEYFYFVEPFYKAMVIDVCAFLLVLAFWFRPGQWDWLRVSAVGLVLLALVMHTGGLLFRMFLEGRPPVTNLYSSAIFIGWGATVLGLVLERFWRNSIGVMVSCIIGFLTLIIAHHLQMDGDTMEMMRAVLDNNFWLSTHVVVVTLGYASTFVAGMLGILYVILGVFTPNLKKPIASAAGSTTAKKSGAGDMGVSLNRMIYGILCFATLFSFVGTVLGGIWADQSWGRFWGWDPKENGALIIVLWNALVLHARWGGLVRERGLANLAIVGNIVTSWSWFGVNMLGIGLHSYGFTAAAFRWLSLFVASQIFLVLMGCLPKSMWRSFQSPEAAGTGVPPGSIGAKGAA